MFWGNRTCLFVVCFPRCSSRHSPLQGQKQAKARNGAECSVQKFLLHSWPQFWTAIWTMNHFEAFWPQWAFLLAAFQCPLFIFFLHETWAFCWRLRLPSCWVHQVRLQDLSAQTRRVGRCGVPSGATEAADLQLQGWTKWWRKYKSCQRPFLDVF